VKRRAFGAWAATSSLGLGAPIPLRAAASARIAWISASTLDSRSSFLDALKLGLGEHGRVEGRDYAVEEHWGDGSRERLDPLVAEMLRSKPDLIVSQGPIIFNVQRSQTALPVLFSYSGDPVEARLVDSLARPGRNLSGISMMALELVGKRMEALAEAVPGLKKVAVITNPAHAGEQGEFKASQAAAVKLGLQLEYVPFESENGLDAALASAVRSRSQALMVFPDAGMMRRSEQFAEFARQNRIPAASGWAEFARRGNLLSYGPNVRQVYRRLASYVDRVLLGTKPADLPIELPTVIEHVINLRAARAMGLVIPRSALLRADEVIG
jgi:putative tryptophan/tyrosine transport system substrate-binding protein